MSQPPPLPQKKTSGLAITSLIFGILGFACCGLLGGIVAIILGHVAYTKINRSEGRMGGEGLAIAGFVLGYASFITTFILAGLAIPAISGAMAKGQLMAELNHARKIQIAIASMALDGETANDKSLGFPADAGITTVTELKNRLVEKGYLSAKEAEILHFENFLIGNVSASDPKNTIFIRTRTQDSAKGFIIMRMGGDGMALKKNQPIPDDLAPPRDPPYLKP